MNIFAAYHTEFMQKTYIWEHNGWPYLIWDSKELSPLLGEVRNKQGQLTGKISILGDDLKRKTLHDTIVSDIMASARIEGRSLDEKQVVITTDRYLSKKKIHLSETDDISVGASQVFFDALYNYKSAVTEERLFSWKYALDGKTDNNQSMTGWGKTDFILSPPSVKPAERKMEYLKIPIPQDSAGEMKAFLTWINTLHPTDPVIKAGAAYLRFLLIRPFENENGRIARNIANIFLSRADLLPERFYSISAQIERDRQQYNEILTDMQTGSLDITEWLRWFLYCMENALIHAEEALTHVLNKSKFFDKYRLLSLNDRQLKMINMLWDGFDYKLSSSTWASINNCSSDTALRDIQDLISKNIFRKENAGGRSTSYCLDKDSF
jgi:Fic family protein